MACTLPHLGLATTRELLDELRARIEVHALGGLDYRTVDGEKFAKAAGEPKPVTGNRRYPREEDCEDNDEGA